MLCKLCLASIANDIEYLKKKIASFAFAFAFFVFQLEKSGARSYLICADDAQTMKMWMNALCLAAIAYTPGRDNKDLPLPVCLIDLC